MSTEQDDFLKTNGLVFFFSKPEELQKLAFFKSTFDEQWTAKRRPFSRTNGRLNVDFKENFQEIEQISLNW